MAINGAALSLLLSRGVFSSAFPRGAVALELKSLEEAPHLEVGVHEGRRWPEETREMVLEPAGPDVTRAREFPQDDLAAGATGRPDVARGRVAGLLRVRLPMQERGDARVGQAAARRGPLTHSRLHGRMEHLRGGHRKRRPEAARVERAGIVHAVKVHDGHRAL